MYRPLLYPYTELWVILDFLALKLLKVRSLETSLRIIEDLFNNSGRRHRRFPNCKTDTVPGSTTSEMVRILTIIFLTFCLDYSAGFGGKYGVQKDRVDQSAVGYEHQEKLSQHSSQKDYSQGFGGKYGVQTDRKDQVYCHTQLDRPSYCNSFIHCHCSLSLLAVITEREAGLMAQYSCTLLWRNCRCRIWHEEMRRNILVSTEFDTRI